MLEVEGGEDIPLNVINDRNSVKYIEETETTVRTRDPILSIAKGSIPEGTVIEEESIIKIDNVSFVVRDVMEDSAYMIKLDLTRA